MKGRVGKLETHTRARDARRRGSSVVVQGQASRHSVRGTQSRGMPGSYVRLRYVPSREAPLRRLLRSLRGRHFGVELTLKAQCTSAWGVVHSPVWV